MNSEALKTHDIDLWSSADANITDLRAFYHLAFLNPQAQHKSHINSSSSIKD